MAALKNALIQLASMLNLQYTVLSTKGDELEAQQVAFAAIADIKDSGCLDECVTSYETSPIFITPESNLLQGTILFGLPTIGYYTIDQPFTYTGTDATGFLYKVDSGTPASAVSPIQLTSLNPITTYRIHVAPLKGVVQGAWQYVDVTTLELLAPQGEVHIGTGASGGGTFNPLNGTFELPFTYTDDDADSFDIIVDGQLYGNTTTSPAIISGLTQGESYFIYLAGKNGGGGGFAEWIPPTNPVSIWIPLTVGEIIFGTPTITETTIDQPFTYTGNDDLYFTGSVDNDSFGYPIVSPIKLTNLDEGTAYTIGVGVYAQLGEGPYQTGPGVTNSTIVTTLVATVVPSNGVMTLSEPYDITPDGFSIDFNYSGTDANKWLVRVITIYDDGNGGVLYPIQEYGVAAFNGFATSPFTIDGLPAGAYQVTVTPYNSVGGGTTTSLYS